MGLFDEAIREHLDLRRRHGADPDEVAREELDALSPVEREEGPEGWSATVGSGPEGATGEGRPFDGRRERIDAGGDSTPEGQAERSAEVGFMEETAEIDMRAVLGELEHAMSDEEAAGDPRVRRVVRAAKTTAPLAVGSARAAFDFEAHEDPFAWETPVPRARRVARGREQRPEAPGS